VQDISERVHLPYSLATELEAWAAAEMRPKVWWRDDDATSDTPQLRRLLEVARHRRLVPALAVIPESADGSLVKLLSAAQCCVWQHGWGHHSYSYGEFGDGRPMAALKQDALLGQRSLDHTFGPNSWQRVFVPPFHALSVPFKALLPELGYLGLSAGLPLTPRLEHVFEVNAEIDIIDWSARRFIGPSSVSKLLTEGFAARRQGQLPADEPLGLLTHHLVMQEDAWAFVDELFECLRAEHGVQLVGAYQLFPPPAATTAQDDSSGVTAVITSCGRQDLLTRMLDSFLRYNTYPLRKVIIIEDGDAKQNRELEGRYRQHRFDWMATGRRLGQIAAIDRAYQCVQTEFIFHCEDDWEFIAPGFIEQSLRILQTNSEILQVVLRALNDTHGVPISEYTLFADDVAFRLVHPAADLGEWGTWHGFSFNPGVRRLQDYRLLGSYSALDPLGEKTSMEVERQASAEYKNRGFLAAILAGNAGRGYVRHIGGGRQLDKRLPQA